jgi:hypothetical protein
MRSVTPVLIAALLFVGYGFGEKQKSSDPATVTFNIRIGHTDQGTEGYKIVHSQGGYLLTSTVNLRKYGEPIFSEQQQRLASDWSPLQYTLKTTIAQSQRTSGASIANGKVVMHSESGPEAKDKTIELQSPTLVFDNIVPSQFQVLVKQYNALHAQQAVQFQFLVPQILGQFTGTLKPAGADNGTLGNRKVLLKKYILETRGLNLEIWADSQGQLMRVYLPARNTEFIRTDFRMGPSPASASASSLVMVKP